MIFRGILFQRSYAKLKTNTEDRVSCESISHLRFPIINDLIWRALRLKLEQIGCLFNSVFRLTWDNEQIASQMIGTVLP